MQIFVSDIIMDNKLKEFVDSFLEKEREEQKKTLEKEMGILKQNKMVQEVKKFKSYFSGEGEQRRG